LTLLFGYGSLVDSVSRARTLGADVPDAAATLSGFVRSWSVAMDNARDVPGYKYYLDAATGRRPPVAVTFVDLVPERGTIVNGRVFPVDEEMLARLDARERGYRRREVTDRVAVEAARWMPAGPPPRVVTYAGTRASVELYERAWARGRARVAGSYLATVHRAFARLGRDERRAFERSTRPPDAIVAELIRVDLSVAAGARSSLCGGRT